MTAGRSIADARPRVVAAVAARFRDLDLAEDAFAAAAEKLLRDDGDTIRNVPGWLFRVATRQALDIVRADRRRSRTEESMAETIEPAEILHLPDPIPDERLRLLFVCCHLALSPEARVALALKVVCGVEVETIATAFAVPPQTMYRRITRAKTKIRDAGIPFELPERRLWPERIASVLGALEVGYWIAYSDAGRTAGDDFADETARLAQMLVELLPRHAEVLGFAALLALAGSRRAARIDGSGAMVPLSRQDPALWDKREIERGRALLDRALARGIPGPYQAMAAIHLAHAMRAHGRPVDWRAILSSYDALAAMRPGPLVAINRAMALAEVEGADGGLAALDALDAGKLSDHRPLHAARAALLERSGRMEQAIAALDMALMTGPGDAERLYLEAKRAALLRN